MESDDLLTLSEAARTVPRPVSPSTIFRWHRSGIRARNGERVRLEAMRYGGRLFVARGELENFARRLARADAAADDAEDDQRARATARPASRAGSSDREAQIAAADERTRAAGI